ncbi:MAG: phosphoenolpyruvate synthase [Muribaculaceae bacterium]|nr:phosphoenolpyruvate synthase [Muribaculaceae bacterium]
MNEALLSQLYLKDTAFHNLMQERIYNVLLVASTYDAFMLEEDGRVEEQIYFEYVSLNLSSPPRVTRVSDYDEAVEVLAAKHFDLIIAMPGVDLSATFVRAREIKENYPEVPFVVLTPFSREVSLRLSREDLTGVDYVFSWLGNVDLLVAIIKLLEDKMNAPADVNEVGVQMIMLVEDSVRFYSSILPTLYKFILRQSRQFSTEALNPHEAMLRMRGRPKVMLARDYEEALRLYDAYSEHVLGVISDVSFNRRGAKDQKAGIALAHELRARDPHLPIIVESSEPENRRAVEAFGGTFLDKNSKKLPVDLGDAIMEHFGFGDFVLRDPGSGNELMRIHDLKELQYNMFSIPAESLFYHARQNDISRWLYSRALFPIAQVIKMHRFTSIDDAPAARQLFFDLIVKYRKMKNRGVVAEFRRGRFDKYSNFARIGQGSLGGKGRGLAFVDSIIKQNPVCDDFDGVAVRIPHTVVLCTDIFDEFMEANRLYPLALSDAPDEQILHAFLAARLPHHVVEDLAAIYDVIEQPMAVRSSSLLEDSHYQPFAGVYSTYMVPHLTDKAATVAMLEEAVKAVYASVFYADSKAYMVATSNVIDQEKMAVIIQEMVGQQHGDYFFPSFSAVGRSLNYYPVGDEAPADGVCQVAVGLGKYIVDGGRALRFSPLHPHHVLQTSTTKLALRDTQTHFCALDVANYQQPFSLDEGRNIAQLPVQPHADNGELQYMVSTYDYHNDRMLDTDAAPGRKVVTFANVLNHDVFPLAKITQFMLEQGQRQMGRPVEIELAGVIASQREMQRGHRGELYWLQIRPMIDRREMLDDTVIHAPVEQVLLRSNNAIGHGTMDGVTGVVMVKPEFFSFENNLAIAEEIAKINRNFTDWGENYILVGVGRWGSSDTALGIPVKWQHISAARVIVEMALPDGTIEPSQGTHFFQNLTSFGVGYVTLDARNGEDVIDLEFIQEQKPYEESDFVKVLRFDHPLQVAINGQQGIAVVLKPHD